jgi:hypothetical protein
LVAVKLEFESVMFPDFRLGSRKLLLIEPGARKISTPSVTANVPVSTAVTVPEKALVSAPSVGANEPSHATVPLGNAAVSAPSVGANDPFQSTVADGNDAVSAPSVGAKLVLLMPPPAAV